MRIQIKPCIDDGGNVRWCDPSERSEPAYFGVYLGEPGAYAWVADFANEEEAVWYAEALQDRLELEDQEDFT